MNIYEEQLNHFFVDTFNDILRLEEESMAKGNFKNLSVHEIHVIEAVCNNEKNGTNTMKSISENLAITASSLTIAIKTLEQKGYVVRKKDKLDKRKVLVCSTDLAKKAYIHHSKFHCDLIKNVSSHLNEAELKALTQALKSLQVFFTKDK